jgi:hypothetical protein
VSSYKAKMQCQVCCDRPVHGKRGSAACGRCGFRLCRECARQCATTEHGARCPSCHLAWDTAERRRRLGVGFANGPYRVARRAHLVQREMARMETSVPVAARERERRRLVAERNALDVEIRSGHADLATLWPRYREIQLALGRLLGSEEGAASASSVRCAHDGCPGYLDADAGVCTACERRTCARCHEALSDDGRPHECDPDAVASRDAIARECRPCAQCGAASARIEGCPVMWCVKCHAFWNWNTGRIIEGRAPHNPDHRAWVAAGSMREVDDVPCGGLPDAFTTNEAMMRSFLDGHTDVGVHTIVSAFNCLHRAQDLRHSYARAWDESRETEPMRVAFLLGDYDEDRLGQALERHERLLHFRRDVGIALETLVLAGADVMQRFCAADLDCAHAATELWSLHEIVDAALRDVARVHARTAPLLQEWNWVLPYARRPVE